MKKLFYLLLILILSQVSIGKQINSREKEVGFTGVYHLNENTGTVAVDSTGNGNNGTITDGAWVTGKYGAGLYFNGTSAKVEMSETPFETAEITFKTWINVYEAAGANPRFAAIYDGPGGWEMYASGANNSPFGIGINTAMAINITGVTALYWNKWYHVTFTWDKVSLKIYVNGVLYKEGTGDTGDFVYTSQTFTLGKRSVNNTEWFPGMLDEVAHYGKPLSQGEIMQHYLEGKGRYIN